MTDGLEAMPTISDRNLIQQFVDSSVVGKRDYQLLDILWGFSYCLSQTSKSGWYKHKKDTKESKKWLGTICKRNLQKKHNLSLLQIREKVNVFLDFLNSMPDFLSYETYDEDAKLLGEVLMGRTSTMLTGNTEGRLRAISAGLDTQILSFVLSYIPEKIQESLRRAEECRVMNQSYSDKYMVLSDFCIKENKETGEISYFEIGTKEWTYLFNFNAMSDQELREYTFKSKSSRSRSGAYLILPYEQYDEYSFWQFGDELVKLGVGYWAFWLSEKGIVRIQFVIPKFIYDVLQLHEKELPQIEDISAKVSQITKEQIKDKWALGGLEDSEVVSKVPESEIEDFIVLNPNILDDGLEVVGRQFRTTIGLIDILCKDKNENIVVVELKRGRASDKVAGQIQRYMTWVNENLANGKQVRGIIVAKTCDEQLEHAIRGSKFLIEIKKFDIPPIQENIKYCEKCRKPNRISAKYCVECGREFYL